MAGQDRAAAGGEEAIAVVEALQKLFDAQDAHAYGGQFDGERETVQAAAQAGHGDPVVGCEPEAGDHRGGAVGEEGEGRVGVRRAEVAVRVGDG